MIKLHWTPLLMSERGREIDKVTLDSITYVIERDTN